ncbi:unnamed protein product [Closterium sp. Yama58-4]|nr:unnamed protein product [Closterium sp. Yama58-4]
MASGRDGSVARDTGVCDGCARPVLCVCWGYVCKLVLPPRHSTDNTGGVHVCCAFYNHKPPSLTQVSFCQPCLSKPTNLQGLSATDKKKVETLRLTDADWETLHAVKAFLSPFARISKAAEGAAYPTVSMVVPYYNGLIDALEARLAKGPSAALKPMIEAASGVLKKYAYMSSNELWIATFLDPSKKAAWFDDAHWESQHPETEPRVRPRPTSSEVVQLVRDRVAEYQARAAALAPRAPPLATVTEEEEGDAADDDEDAQYIPSRRRLAARLSASQQAGRGGMLQDDEVSRYLSERVRDDVTALEYWRTATNVQTLRRMARDYLAIPAISASSERVFSLGCNVISWKRHRLASQRTRAIMLGQLFPGADHVAHEEGIAARRASEEERWQKAMDDLRAAEQQSPTERRHPTWVPVDADAGAASDGESGGEGGRGRVGQKRARHLGSHFRLVRDLLSAAETAKAQLQQLLTGEGPAGRVTLTTDIWTSQNNVAFMVVIAHGVTSDFQLQQIVIDFRPLEGRHTGDKIASGLEEVIGEWALGGGEFFGVTTDNVENNNRAVRLLVGVADDTPGSRPHDPPVMSLALHFK